MTKKYSIWGLMACMAAAILLGSCKKEKKYTAEEEFIRPASMIYSSQDSADINTLVDEYIALFKDKNFATAAEMLYTFRSDSVFPLTKEAKEGYVKAYEHMPIYDCRKEAFVLRSDRNNEVRLAIQVMESGNIDKNVGVTRTSLNPVKVGDKWYLTLLDKDAEGVKDVYKQ